MMKTASMSVRPRSMNAQQKRPLQQIRFGTLAFVLLLVVLSHTSARAQSLQASIKAIGAGVVGGHSERNSLVGAGISLELNDVLQVFAEATFEVGQSYPADTQEPPSRTSSINEPAIIIIVNAPFAGNRTRVNATYFGGLRLITPPDRNVRTFVAAGIGLAQFKVAAVSYPDGLPTGYYTDNVNIWGAGGGLSKTVRERWVVEGEYRWCHPWSEFASSSFHRVQAGFGLTF